MFLAAWSDFMDNFEIGEFNFDDFLSFEEAVSEKTNKCAVAKKVLFAIDASNSMSGYKIGAVNDTVNNAVSKLKSLQKSSDCEVHVRVIGFSDRLFKWSDDFLPVFEFKYSNIETAGGITDINALFEELIKMADSVQSDSQYYVFFFTDGLPTSDYAALLKQWLDTSRSKGINSYTVSFEEDIQDEQSYSFLCEFSSSGDVININHSEDIMAEIFK